MRFDYLIIGNSAGGIGAIEAIRQIDQQGSVALVSDESYPVYSRPLISEFLAGERDIDGIRFRSPDYYDRMAVHTFFGKRAVSLDTGEGIVVMNDGQKVTCGKLLLAAGGLPIIPPVAGRERAGVFSFTTLDDAIAIAGLIEAGARRVVVIGGGLIGISVTDALVKRGMQVTIVELMDRILGTVLDPAAAEMAGNTLADAGVDIRTGQSVRTIIGADGDADRAGGVILDSGETIDADLVIFAIGVQPRVDLVADTGVAVKRGILVDRHMATSIPHIYACGDVAEAYDYIQGSQRVVPIWPAAHIGGRIAGFNMAGREAVYPGGTAMNSIKYFGLSIVSAGLVNPPATGEYEILTGGTGADYRRFVISDGRLVGMVLVNGIDKAGIYYGLIRDQVPLDGCRDRLAGDGFGLISLPEDIVRQRLELPHLGRLHVFHEVEAMPEPVTEG